MAENEKCPVCLKEFTFNYQCIICYVCQTVICEECHDENRITTRSLCPCCREFMRPKVDEVLYLFSFPVNYKYYSYICYELAEKFEYTDRIKQHRQKAYEWYYKAAIRGDPRAQCKIAETLSMEEGNAQEVMDWYYKAAYLGDYNYAYYNLGKIHELQKDYSKAYNCYHKAAKRNLDIAFYSIGLLTLKGLGVKQDETEAIKMLEIAYEKGYTKASVEIGKIYFDKKEYEKALDLFHTSCKDYDNEAFYYLGLMYGKGLGVEKSLTRSIEFNEKALIMGNTKASKLLKKINKLIDSENV